MGYVVYVRKKSLLGGLFRPFKSLRATLLIIICISLIMCLKSCLNTDAQAQQWKCRAPTTASLRCNPKPEVLRNRLHWRMYARVQSQSWADSGLSGTWGLQKLQAEPFLVSEGYCMPGDSLRGFDPPITRKPYWLHITFDNGIGVSCVSNILARN